MFKQTETSFLLEGFIPSLLEVVKAAGLKADHLSVTFPLKQAGGPIAIPNRQRIYLYDGAKPACWEVASLQSLFRGNTVPPSLREYPPEYVDVFYFIEKHVLRLCDAMGDRRDKEMEEIYTALRRRPDGKSLGVVHDVVWQLAAMVLGQRPLSQAEFTAVFDRLAQSCRAWQMGAASRHYATYLRQTFG